MLPIHPGFVGGHVAIRVSSFGTVGTIGKGLSIVVIKDGDNCASVGINGLFGEACVCAGEAITDVIRRVRKDLQFIGLLP